MTTKRPTAIVYIDGLNLYRQNLAQHPELKWLNVVRLCEILLPTHEITMVRYFTSEVRGYGSSAESIKRQQVYWRALGTLGHRISIHLGKMRTSERVYLVAPIQLDHEGRAIVQKVKRTEEKGTDTALAAYMVLDAARNPCDLHVLMSSDSDFEPVLNLIKTELQVATGLFSPVEKPSTSLQRANPFITKIVRKSLLEDSQFCDSIIDSSGIIHRPEAWKKRDPLT